MSQKRLTISISQIAPLVGLDAYNNFPRIICEIWRKHDPQDFKIYETKLKDEGNQLATSNEMNDIWETDEALGTNLLQQVKNINSATDKTSNDMVSKQELIIKDINNNEKLAHLDTKQKADLAQKVCSVTNKMHGINNEDTILAEFCRLSEKTISSSNEWVKSICVEKSSDSTNDSTNDNTNDNTNHNIEWVIIGKYDGITTDNELVEAKMRQKCLFKKVRDYENVQVQLYLHALQFEQAYLVESYTNKKNERNIYVNEIKYDEDYVVNTILERIKKFIKFYELFMIKDTTNNSTNNKIKEDLLKGDKNRKIYKMYETEFLGIEGVEF
jgi:hypothetical protein